MLSLRTIVFVSLALATGSAQAISISPSELPTAISNCSNCIVLPESSSDLSYMSVFELYRLDSNGIPSHSHLIRYTLNTDSTLNSIDYMNGDPEYTHIDYSGYMWMEAPDTLQGFNTQFNIYTDQTSHSSWLDGFHTDNTWTFALDFQATQTGSGSITGTWSDDAWEYIYTGNMAIIDGIALCIECGASARLNLVGFGYDPQGNFTLNPNDPRALLLSYNDYWELRQTSRSFYVQAVPLPAAGWLFLSGIMAFTAWRRSTRHTS